MAVSPALLDVNVLLALAWPNHQHHTAAHTWFADEGAVAWATCALTQLAFVRLSSNPAYTAAAVAPRGAVQLLAAMTQHAGHRYWETLPEPRAANFGLALGHQQVMDAYLVRVAATHRGVVATFDRRLSAHAHRENLVRVIAP